MSVRPPPPCLYASHTAKIGVQLCIHAFQFTETLRPWFTNDILEKLILSFPCCPGPCMITPSHYNGGATPLTAPLELLNATNYHLFGQPSPTTPYRCPSQFKLDSIFLNFCPFQMNILQNSATLVWTSLRYIRYIWPPTLYFYHQCRSALCELSKFSAKSESAKNVDIWVVQ